MEEVTNEQFQAEQTRRHRRGTGRATIKDVAKRAGVGAITVSRALREPDTVSETLRARINAAVEELGYVRNRIAGSLATARTRAIPVIVPSLSNAVFARVLRGIQDVLGAANFQPLIANTDYSLTTEETLVRTLLEWSPAGMILTGLAHTHATRRLVAEARIPVVEMMELDAELIDMGVGLSHVRGGFSMTRHLLERGYHRIGFVGTRLDRDLRAAQRFEGCKAALAEAGLAPPVLVHYRTPSTYALGGQAILEILRNHPDIEAVFFANDDLAVGAILECARQGIPVPGRVAVAGFNGLEIGNHIIPRLTTVLVPRLQIGQVAAEKILHRILGEDESESVTDVGFEILTRDST